jgi:hypothetical protein
LQVKFKQKGKYKVETEPYGPKNGAISFCQNASKTVYVGMQPVGNVSGPGSIACNDAQSVLYFIPPVPGALEYRWAVTNSNNIGFGIPTLTNGGATATFPVSTVTTPSATQTVSVTVLSKCTGEAAVTRSTTVYRYGVDASITQRLPPAVCTGNRYEVRAINGNNYRWVATFYNGTGQVLRTDTYYGALATIQIPADTRITGVGYMLYYTNVCNGSQAQIGSGSSVSSFGCTPGARQAAQPEAAMSAGAHPNPVSDVLTVHIPEADGDGGFTAQLRDGLQRTALTGSTPNGILQMDVRRLPAGVYLLKTVRPSGAVATQKVLVIH